MSQIQDLEQQLDAAKLRAATAYQASLDVQNAVASIDEISAQLEAERQRQVYEAIHKDVAEGLLPLREIGDRINKLSQELKSELLRFAKLSQAVNLKNRQLPQRMDIVHSQYDPGSLPAVVWSEETSATPLHLMSRESLRLGLFQRYNGGDSPYGKRLLEMANLGEQNDESN